MTISELYQYYLRHPSVQTDTRKIKQGDIFFALKGPNFNGNHFAKQALEMGASYAVVDEKVGDGDPRVLLFDDVLTTLQLLAKHHREQFRIPFIGITGSNGKTTSKELIYAVLSSHYKTYTTQGNLNNHIGVPLTLLAVKQDAEMAVIEMGANHQKEIEGYCVYAQPTHGVITNAGKAHLEGFGGEEGVRKGKAELYNYLGEHNGIAFIFEDYEYLWEMAKHVQTFVPYSTTGRNGVVQGHIVSNEPFLTISVSIKQGEAFTIQTKLVGDYNLPNVLCAVAVGDFFLVPQEKIKQAIENYTPSNSRSQLVQKDSNSIILDAYNANPTSMKAAIENFAHLKAEKKVLMLGGMMELGDESIEEHKNIIALIKKYKWQDVVLVGGDFQKIDHGFIFFADSLQAREWYANQHFSNTHILIKGSRSMKMERILD